MNHWLLSIILFTNLTQCSDKKSENNASSLAVNLEESPETGYVDTSWTEKVIKSNAEWKKILTPEQYHITREQGTERPFTSELNDNHEEGIFMCVSCNNPLFSSKAKFNSGTGWPSFFAPYFSRSVKVSNDETLGMSRDEISCARCDAHLGHVFNDGPRPTGLRYCMDGVALKFEKNAKVGVAPKFGKAIFAAGCFWCMEAVFESIKGVKNVVSGYAGGNEENPTYEQVGSGMTGHAESIEVSYDTSVISYASLVRVFFAAQDPTQVNGQGPDHGSQYRSIAFYNNDEEKKVIENYIKQLTASGKYSKPIAAQVVPTTRFWKAEDYHQNYVRLHPEDSYVQHESIPRLNRALEQLKDLLKDNIAAR